MIFLMERKLRFDSCVDFQKQLSETIPVNENGRTCAKGLSSGYVPLAATIFSDEIWDEISTPGFDRFFACRYTYSGYPVSCAAALKN